MLEKLGNGPIPRSELLNEMLIRRAVKLKPAHHAEGIFFRIWYWKASDGAKRNGTGRPDLHTPDCSGFSGVCSTKHRETGKSPILVLVRILNSAPRPSAPLHVHSTSEVPRNGLATLSGIVITSRILLGGARPRAAPPPGVLYSPSRENCRCKRNHAYVCTESFLFCLFFLVYGQKKRHCVLVE